MPIVTSSCRLFRHFPENFAKFSISIAAPEHRLRYAKIPDKSLAVWCFFSSQSSSNVSAISVRHLAKSRRFSDIEILIESLKSKPKITQEPFFTTLIRFYGIAGMLDHAIRTYEQMDSLGTPRSSISFNAVLSACNQSKKFDQVPILFSELSKKYNVFPDKISYGILIRSYCESSKPELAYSLLQQMRENEIEITSISYTILLDCFYKTGNVEKAEKIWKEMIEDARCKVDVAAYNVRIGDAHGGKPEEVLKLISEMTTLKLKPDTISYNFLMTCYCKNDQIEEAMNVYENLEINGCSPNSATYRTLMFYLCRSRDYDKALEIFRQSAMKNKIPDFGTTKHLVEGLVKNSRLKEAKRLIMVVKKKFPPNLLNGWRKLELELGLIGQEETAKT